MTQSAPHNSRYGGPHSDGPHANPHANPHTNPHTNRHGAHAAPFWGLPDPDTQAEFYADVPVKRAIAWVIDTVLILALSVLAVLFTAGIGVLFFFFIVTVIGFTYRTVTLANGSATLGMRLVAIEIRRANGEKLDLATAVLHTIGYHISFAVILLQVASIVLMLTTARAQGLTDHLLGTAAINRPAKA